MTSLFAKTVIARAALKTGTPKDIAAAMRARWQNDPAVTKAAVTAGTTADADWAGSLASAGVAEFVGSLTGTSAFYNLLSNGFRRVPLRARIGSVISAPVAHRPAEGMPLPVSRMGFASGALSPVRVGSVVVVSEELLQNADPAAEALFESELRTAVATAADAYLITVATAGVTPTTATANYRADVRALLDTVATPGGRVVFIAGQRAANAMVAVDPNGTMTPEGGAFLSVPVIVSAAVATDSIVAVQGGAFVAGEDGIRVETSHHAAFEMLDSSLGQNTSGDGAQLVSMFQTNSAAILASAWLGVEAVRANAAAVLSDVNWGV
ncbi:hypothetical protein QEZ48_08445 [Aquamicrobium lusatiense]|uniref:hypothetical protein n=1 Tax=Aquamicrobium lusatiense TaxID=89772 RepID=UPI0024565E74|nr:hypothetical protein [Aquamicrobium lusatiense]MDH4990859.1 hypothetical protein [Aquamicrobium lusatiense]